MGLGVIHQCRRKRDATLRSQSNHLDLGLQLGLNRGRFGRLSGWLRSGAIARFRISLWLNPIECGQNDWRLDYHRLFWQLRYRAGVETLPRLIFFFLWRLLILCIAGTGGVLAGCQPLQDGEERE